MVNVELAPLTVTLVGHGVEPTAWTVADRAPANGVWSFRGMSLVERAALRALCVEAIAMIDNADKETA